MAFSALLVASGDIGCDRIDFISSYTVKNYSKERIIDSLIWKAVNYGEEYLVGFAHDSHDGRVLKVRVAPEEAPTGVLIEILAGISGMIHPSEEPLEAEQMGEIVRHSGQKPLISLLVLRSVGESVSRQQLEA